MADGVLDGEQSLDLRVLRRTLLGNSTNRRSVELQSLSERIDSKDVTPDQFSPILDIVFDTYPLYIDSKSRQAAEQCLFSILRAPGAEAHVPKFIGDVEKETGKPGIAPANAFVLIRWCSLLLQQYGQNRALWDAWGIKTVHALARATTTFLSSGPRESTRQTSLRVTRRGFRKLFSSDFGEEPLNQSVSALAAKAASPSPHNAVILGFIAGVSSRLPSRRDALQSRKADYNAFYLREVIGSRTALPAYIADGLHDYFCSFVSLEDLKREIVPAVEKALLRAPEVVLNDLVAPMIQSLPEELDLSDILVSNLLKPLTANVKSTNAVIRSGALRTFSTTVSRCSDEKSLEKVADELLTPLKQGKVTAADQRTSFSQMLSALKSSPGLATKVPTGLAPVAVKEANEAAAAAETEAISKHLQYGLQHDIAPDAATTDAFVKGLGEKRLPFRKLWGLRLAETLWPLNEDLLQKPHVAPLIDATAGKLIDIWNEVLANPMPAIQTGQVSVACAATALSLSKLAKLSGLKCASTLKKVSISDRVLAMQPKPSFLLNARVYTKLTGTDDLTWFLRALAASADNAPAVLQSQEVAEAWAQAYIYLIAASGVPASAKSEASRTLRELYLAQPAPIAKLVTDGISRWCIDVEQDAKESAAVASRAGRNDLYKVVRCVSVAKEDAERASTVSQDILDKQLVDLLIVCRSDLVPRAEWIETCLKTGTDPGDLVRRSSADCMKAIIAVTEDSTLVRIPAFQTAAFNAAADLAFVAPDTLTSVVLEQISNDLDPRQLESIGPTEAAIFRTPEGTAFVDVLAKQTKAQPPSKNSKDYDTLKWEEELRAQLAQKKGQTKKLTSDEQAKVNAQLAKEAGIRREVAGVEARLRRGMGIVTSLVSGPPTETESWFGPATTRLMEVIDAGAGLILGDAAALTYLHCAQRTSSRLGPMRPFVGVATLRAADISVLPANMQEEPLGDLITRVLYRLRFLGEQRPFDVATLSYILPLIFLVLEKGGVGRPAGEEVDEQIVLATEFLTFSTQTCSDIRLPRQRLLSVLISSLQAYQQHFRPIRDCFTDLCRSIASNATESELVVVVKGTIVPEAAVRTAVLQAISAELDLTDHDFYEGIWLAKHDDLEENVDIADEIWEENDMKTSPDAASLMLPHLESTDAQLRRAAARSLAGLVTEHPVTFKSVLSQLKTIYKDRAKPRVPERDEYGMPRKMDLADPWQARHGISLAYKELASIFVDDELVPFMQFLVVDGPLGDKNGNVRDGMVDAATAVVTLKGGVKVEELMKLFEDTLATSDKGSQNQDQVNEAVVILYGALARHLKAGDSRVPKVVQRLLSTLSTPSDQPIRQADDGRDVAKQKYASRRGAAYGLAGIIKGRGIAALREFRVMPTLAGAVENKKDPNQRQGAFLAYELLSLVLGRVFEPYVIQIVPQLLVGFGDTSADVREACLDAAKTCFATLSSFGVKQVLPMLLEGLDEQQWRSKREHLALSLPEIIPPLTETLNDSHKEVRTAANKSLQRFGEVISNPEIKSQVNILLKALSDPTKYTDEALDALIKVNFIHYLDAPSLALVVRILQRGLGDRSATKRKASQIIGSLAHLTDRKDLVSHLPILVAGLRVAIVDPVPTTRATASKALGSTIEKLGEDALPDLIPSLMATLKSDTGAGDRLGSAQALSEVLAGLGTARLEETLPTILQNVSSSKASVREGFMSLFIFLPACFGNSFANYLGRIIPPILSGLADDIESIRETALRAGRLLVKNFATRAIDLLLPELERGLADDSHRIRLSSVELVGDLLFNLTGISGKAEQEEAEEGANEAGQSLLEVLGEERRNKVLSALYICRCDTSGLVRTAAVNVWKALVATPLLIRRLASTNMEQKVIAGNALGELIRKAGEGVLATLLPTLEEGLQTSTDTDAKQGICIALRELIASASPEALEDYEKHSYPWFAPPWSIRMRTSERLQQKLSILSRRSSVLPYLLNLLRSEDEAENALSALLTLLTEQTRSNIILPNLLPTLLTPPITAFNARALASLAEVASSAMTRRLPNILNALMDGIIASKDAELKTELEGSFDAVLLSVDEFDGLNTAMSVMLALVKHDDHRKRAAADLHLAKFFSSTEIDISRYYPDLIRVLLIAFDDSDSDVVKAAWTALSALTQRLRKEEMESLVISTRQALNQVGVPGHSLPGFSLPKGINAILPIFLQGLMNGNPDQRTQAALAISDMIDRTSADSLKPFVTQITGPLIRVVSERSVEVKAAILLTLNNLLEKIPTFLKPFLPQLQRTFAKSLADTTSDVLRIRAAKALGTLITLTPRIDPLIAELVTGSKTPDAGVRNAMLKALYEVVAKAGSNMNEASRNGILGLIDSDTGDEDVSMAITNARLLGALIKVLPEDIAAGLIKNRVLTTHFSYPSVLALNSVLLESPESLTGPFAEALPSVICQGIANNDPAISENCVLAAGKYLLTPSSDKSFDTIKPLIESLSQAIAPGGPIDVRRLALVVIRTVSREANDLVRPHLGLLTPPIFGSVRDSVIPVKLAAEAAFLALFSVVEEESEVFDKYMAGPGAGLQPGPKRSMQDYFKRVATRLGAQARERKEAEGGQGGLGLSSDEREDEREVWSVGKVDLGEGGFGDE
ncbi:translational activator of GCN4 [Taxawa tesnikishii (nom. ined.)]|nr:translational activator of GCN4 [Dothideales sp. JES 119]